MWSHSGRASKTLLLATSRPVLPAPCKQTFSRRPPYRTRVECPLALLAAQEAASLRQELEESLSAAKDLRQQLESSQGELQASLGQLAGLQEQLQASQGQLAGLQGELQAARAALELAQEGGEMAASAAQQELLELEVSVSPG